MATIQKRGNKYRALIRLSGRAAVSKTHDTKRKAEAWARDEEAQLRRQRTGGQRSMLVKDAVERYFVEVVPRKRLGSQRAQKAHLEYWSAVLGHVRLDQLTPELVVECREDLASSRGDGEPGVRSRATVNRYLATLGHMVEVARREWGADLASNAVRAVSRLPEPSGRVRFLSDEERATLLDAARAEGGEDLHLAVQLAIMTGMRRAEQLTLRWRHVDLDRRLITLDHTKTGKRRAVPVPLPLVAELAARSEGKSPAAYVFASPWKPGSPTTFQSSWQRAVARAGLADFKWHDLRHTAASYLAMSGASLRDLAEILGHQTLSMVQRYSHLTATHTIAVVDRMTEGKRLGQDAPPTAATPNTSAQSTHNG